MLLPQYHHAKKFISHLEKERPTMISKAFYETLSSDFIRGLYYLKKGNTSHAHLLIHNVKELLLKYHKSDTWIQYRAYLTSCST